VQSNLFHFSVPVLAEPPGIRSTLGHLRFEFPHAPALPLAAPLADGALEERAKPLFPSIPSLPKAETLLLIADAAAKHNVPAAFVQSIVAAESNFNCAAISPRGAIGLMQLMPETAQQFGADPAVPAQNIDAGTRYLRWLMNRYQNSRSSMKRVIAAYNAGPSMVDRYHGIPPFRETQSYVARVLGFLKQFEAARKHAGFKG
jgi:soluble lytic murein transglycosylase-like protein